MAEDRYAAPSPLKKRGTTMAVHKSDLVYDSMA
jgi:hypothetical protein